MSLDTNWVSRREFHFYLNGAYLISIFDLANGSRNLTWQKISPPRKMWNPTKMLHSWNVHSVLQMVSSCGNLQVYFGILLQVYFASITGRPLQEILKKVFHKQKNLSTPVIRWMCPLENLHCWQSQKIFDSRLGIYSDIPKGLWLVVAILLTSVNQSKCIISEWRS